MPHSAEHSAATRALRGSEAEELAETLKALASPGRLRLLVELLEGECSVERLARAAALSPSATSHHLRILRTLRLVRVRRVGRHAFYTLHDDHIADLLAAARHHHEHLYPAEAEELPAPRERSAV